MNVNAWTIVEDSAMLLLAMPTAALGLGTYSLNVKMPQNGFSHLRRLFDTLKEKESA